MHADDLPCSRCVEDPQANLRCDARRTALHERTSQSAKVLPGICSGAPLWDLKSRSFPESDFKNLAALRPAAARLSTAVFSRWIWTDRHSVRSCVVVGLLDPEIWAAVHAVIEPGADGQAIADGMADFPQRPALSRYKHPESFEIVSAPVRDDSGKSAALLRDERAERLKEKRPFRIMSLGVREQGQAER
jgi:hypothetical protein